MKMRGIKLPLEPRPGTHMPMCPRCFGEVTRAFFFLPSKWTRIKAVLVAKNRIPGIWLHLRPCDHVLVDAGIESYMSAALALNGVDLVELMASIPSTDRSS